MKGHSLGEFSALELRGFGKEESLRKILVRNPYRSEESTVYERGTLKGLYPRQEIIPLDLEKERTLIQQGGILKEMP